MSETNNCWAKSIGGCDRISREHIVSKTVLGELANNNMIGVRGAPWNEYKALTLSKNSLVSKNLCKKHNSMLSSLDTEAGKLAKALNEISLFLLDKKYSNDSTSVRLDGNLIERWFLKTSINRLQWHYPKINNLPKELVEIVFGLRKYEKNIGLTQVVHPEGYYIISEYLDGFIDIDILNTHNEPEIMAFSLWGWMFMLPLTNQVIPTNMVNMSFNIPEQHVYKHLVRAIKEGNRFFHPKGICINVEKTFKKEILFNW